MIGRAKFEGVDGSSRKIARRRPREALATRGGAKASEAFVNLEWVGRRMTYIIPCGPGAMVEARVLPAVR